MAIGINWGDDEYASDSMFGPKMGTWWVRSKSDPRWDKDGRGYGLVTSGGPSEVNIWIKSCEKQYGDRPSDLTMGFMKD